MFVWRILKNNVNSPAPFVMLASSSVSGTVEETFFFPQWLNIERF